MNGHKIQEKLPSWMNVPGVCCSSTECLEKFFSTSIRQQEMCVQYETTITHTMSVNALRSDGFVQDGWFILPRAAMKLRNSSTLDGPVFFLFMYRGTLEKRPHLHDFLKVNPDVSITIVIPKRFTAETHPKKWKLFQTALENTPGVEYRKEDFVEIFKKALQ